MTTLDQVQENLPFRILSIKGDDTTPETMEKSRQLHELGFIKGEQVVLLRRTQPGSDPLVVRIGSSTFALRKAEASCIEIEKDLTNAGS